MLEHGIIQAGLKKNVAQNDTCYSNSTAVRMQAVMTDVW